MRLFWSFSLKQIGELHQKLLPRKENQSQLAEHISSSKKHPDTCGVATREVAPITPFENNSNLDRTLASRQVNTGSEWLEWASLQMYS